MKRKRLVRDVKREALARIEDAARTEKDFNSVIAQWNHLDANRERRERDHELNCEDYFFENDYNDSVIIPPPLNHPYWREQLRGDFISTIYDNAEEMSQVIGDKEIADLVKGLTMKQKEILFLRAICLLTSAQIAYSKGRTDRAIRKLLNAALEFIRIRLAIRIRDRLADGLSNTYAKLEFLKWYDEKTALDSDKDS